MKKEYLDVVNSKNEIIGKALRQDFYKKGYWHRASHILVANNEGKIFLAKRKASKFHGRLWGTVGETVKAGENFLTAAKRGVCEETGIKLPMQAFQKIKDIKYKWSENSLKNNEIVQIFLIHYTGLIKISSEHDSFGWFKPQALPNNIVLTPTTRRAIKYYQIFSRKKQNYFVKFRRSNISLEVLWENKSIYKAKEKGIIPLVRLLKHKNSVLKNKIIFDKVVGRAAALLLVYAGVGEVHTGIISQEAVKVFKKYKIYHQYGKLIKHVLNRDKSDVCPFEKMAKGKTPAQFYKLVRNKF